MLDFDALRAEPLRRDPFDHVVLPAFVRPEALAAVARDFPAVAAPGSFPAASLAGGPTVTALLSELQGPAVADAFSEKFGVALADRPRLITVRGRCQAKDGEIHTDSATKILTVLIYLNTGWSDGGGRLRLLRSADDIEDYVAEVPPAGGALVAFRRSERSWHGHLPFVGERRSIQLNWLTSAAVLRRERLRHAGSAAVKRLRGAGAGP